MEGRMVKELEVVAAEKRSQGGEHCCCWLLEEEGKKMKMKWREKGGGIYIGYM